MRIPDNSEPNFFEFTASEVKKDLKGVHISITRGFTPEQRQAKTNTNFFTRKFLLHYR